MSPSAAAIDDGLELTRRAWAFLASRHAGLQVGPLCDFLKRVGALELKKSDRGRILDQAELLFRDFYAHRVFKQELYEARPLEALSRIREEMEGLSELAFHSRMLQVFDQVRDAHTNYIMPPPLSGAVAFLPFQVRLATTEEGHPAFYVTRVMDGLPEGGFGHSTFGTGVRLKSWEGQVAEEAIRGANRLGGNRAASLARGLVRATVRPLSSALPPPEDEETVTLEYFLRGSDELHTIHLMWGVVENLPGSNLPGSAFSLNPAECERACTEKLMWGGHRLADEMAAKAEGPVHEWDCAVEEARCAEAAIAPLPNVAAAPVPAAEVPTAVVPSPPEAVPAGVTAAGNDFTVISRIPEVFEFQHSGGKTRPGFVRSEDLRDANDPEGVKKFGYVRIRSFDSGAPIGQGAELVAEFRRILTLLNNVAPDGLIVDVRGNPGGLIPAAEQMLQLLSPVKVEPAKFHLANTPGVRAILEQLKPLPPASTAAHTLFGPWVQEAPDDGGTITSGQELSGTEGARRLGQPYQGPMALTMDGFTYSAADIFTGGFADHNLGKIVGVGDRTGGGGASVQTHADLLSHLGGMASAQAATLEDDGVKMRIALLRSSRVGMNRDVPIEDVGVRADLVYVPTFEDVTKTFGGLFRFVCSEVLSREPGYRIELPTRPVLGIKSVQVQVKTRAVSRLVFRLAGLPPQAEEVVPGEIANITVRGPIPAVGSLILLIEGLGPDNGKIPVTVAGVQLRAAPVVVRRSDDED